MSKSPLMYLLNHPSIIHYPSIIYSSIHPSTHPASHQWALGLHLTLGSWLCWDHRCTNKCASPHLEGVHPGQCPDHLIVLCLVFWGQSPRLSQGLLHVTFPSTVHKGAPCSTLSTWRTLLVWFWFLAIAILNGCEVASHSGSDLHFFNS